MVERDERQRFVDWMRSVGLAILAGEGSGAASPRLTCVAEVPGDPEFAEQACSFAFQVEFPSIEEARKWSADRLASAAERFTTEFGKERALMFATILESIEI